MYDTRTMKVIQSIEAHSDDVVDLAFWRGLLVTASQDNTANIIDYSKGDDGILSTINLDKPLDKISVLNQQYISVSSDDNAFTIFDGEIADQAVVIDDLRQLTIGAMDGMIEGS